MKVAFVGAVEVCCVCVSLLVVSSLCACLFEVSDKPVMGTVGVDHTKTVTNHVLEIQSVLGIEAARTVLIQEVSNTWD